MNKQQILEEIKRITIAAGGKPPGAKLFGSETGMRRHEWLGKYWVRWGDALREAGYEPNKWVEALDENFLIEKYIEFMRELRRVPLHAELRMKSNSDPLFPSETPFKRLGSKTALVAKVKNYCIAHQGCDDVMAYCDGLPSSGVKSVDESRPKSQNADGFVYLIKSGRHHKIGRSVSVGQRERQLAIQLPDKATAVHSIRTDDPVGIEAYWHKRFGEKRRNGEWFELNSADISAFKRRKFM